ncbi:Selenocysteine-specific elongation factor [Candidatus Sulfobium mesophilum]|uniref:Selenocysteine-specific elongation factor n=1 Tax=Candidatus Sulfobium mesophilum TaxID=2016548 RepID=A0A2U3QHB9_9BACT|nr:Selenocysteine-specific elongation factor [Candidatus Sulfobium mesophilum]
MRHIILGTAGHIDHGKSSLVKALTGIDPDRLKEEKERGITIDIGFADIVFPESELSVGIVDVPGHEKLIRNMLAGAGGIDMVLLVIAADEGIMPQSREHLAICNLLKIKTGLVAITKVDIAEKEWVELVKDEIADFVKGTFLENSPIIPVSARTGENLDNLKKEIREVALNVAPKNTGGLFRLPIDRVFTLKGFGTVVTGTAISGKLSIDDPIEILPADIKAKVRGLHSHGRAIETAFAGQRVAVNLQGVEKESLTRGDVAVTPASFSETKSLDAYLELLPDAPPLKNKSLVHFYAGTSETVARVILYEKEEVRPKDSCYCQFRLQDPVIVVAGDRYIIRRFSPLETLGGGEILDSSPSRRRRKEGIDDLRLLYSGSLRQKISLKIEKSGTQGISLNSIKGWINTDLQSLSDTIGNLRETGEIHIVENELIHDKYFLAIQNEILGTLKAFHRKNPLKPGMSKEEMRNQLRTDARLFNFILAGLKDVQVDKDLLRLRDFKVELSSSEEAFRMKVLELLNKGGFQPPTKEEISSSLKLEPKRLTDILSLMSKEAKAVKVNDSLYLSSRVYDEMLSLVRNFFKKKPEMTVAEFRDLLNTSRKYALPFLEFLDSQKVTLRTGDVRKLLIKM